ncbi:hypothetical protein [Sphingomicrobium arenosum]|uniref:hypothetical protein n=1 Tax=Sphingomicrobium arenosum TaxID=2233861 RepID=UPI00223FA667|nr:hypothetical protein [Sphingomicrobium arenosum]
MTLCKTFYCRFGLLLLVLAAIGTGLNVTANPAAPDAVHILFVTLIGLVVLTYDRFRFID